MFRTIGDWLFDASALTPHGFCLLWEPGLIWTYATSDTAIALAYFSIPCTLAIVARKRADLVFRPLLWLFAAFILLCGATHWLDVLTLWVPAYGFEGFVKAATATVSVATAITLWRLLPKLLALPSPAQLRKAETELRATNDMLVMAEEMAHVGHWRFDVAAQTLSWSEEVYRIHELDPTLSAPDLATAIGFYHPDDRAEVERKIAAAIADKSSFELNVRLVTAKGTLRHCLARGFCETDPKTAEVVALFGVFMDITEITLVQRQLSEKSVNLEATLESIDQGLIKLTVDGRIELANRRFAELLELPSELQVGSPPNASDILDRLSRRGESVDVDDDLQPFMFAHETPNRTRTYEHVRPNGRVLEIRSVSLATGAVVSTLSDVTARWRAEEAVRDSEARYRMLADATSDIIARLDLDLTWRYVSPACRAVLGYEPEELIGRQPSVTIHLDDRAGIEALLEHLASGIIDGDRITATFRACHKQSHWVSLEASVTLVRDLSTGQPQSLISSLRDVTERQRVARQLEQSKEVAENAARVKAEFMANMSHELRTPLTGILGVHDLLAGDPTLDARHRRFLNMARDAGRSLMSIVNDVLDFSKMEDGQLTIESVPFELASLVDACGDLGQQEAQKKALRFERRVQPTSITLVGDPIRLRQILLNLITNAIKFTETGTISVVATYRRDSGRLRIEVSDTGVGIPEDRLHLLFERFSQADSSITRRFGGTGLGLAISKRLCELMGGRIGVTSQDGRGSTFWFELPAAEAPQVVLSMGGAPEQPLAFGPRILLAEDNVINQSIISAMLEKRGCLVTVVGNGAAAVAAVRADHFDVILMDVQMPVMDGLTATQAIRAADLGRGRPLIFIIGLTANAMPEDVGRCIAAGMDAYVAKPIAWSALFAAIDRFSQSPQAA